METSALFPDHNIIAKVLMEDINLLRDEWKEKVDNPSRPILINIDGMVRDLVPSLQKYSIYDRSHKKATQGRNFNSKIRWKYRHVNVDHNIDIFVQLSNFDADRKGTISWGIDWWGSSEASKAVYQYFKKVNNGNEPIKETGGYGATGTTLLLIIKKYTADQLLELKSDIKKEIAKDIKILVQKMDLISLKNINVPQERSDPNYVPIKGDFEKAYRMIASLGQSVSIDAVLNQIEFDAKTSGHKLKNNWRLATERNIEIWATMK
jgi:hypothetical protein